MLVGKGSASLRKKIGENQNVFHFYRASVNGLL